MEAFLSSGSGALTPATLAIAASLWGLALALVGLKLRPRVAGCLGAIAILLWISGVLEGDAAAAWMLPPVAAGALRAAGVHR